MGQPEQWPLEMEGEHHEPSYPGGLSMLEKTRKPILPWGLHKSAARAVPCFLNPVGFAADFWPPERSESELVLFLSYRVYDHLWQEQRKWTESQCHFQAQAFYLCSAATAEESTQNVNRSTQSFAQVPNLSKGHHKRPSLYKSYSCSCFLSSSSDSFESQSRLWAFRAHYSCLEGMLTRLWSVNSHFSDGPCRLQDCLGWSYLFLLFFQSSYNILMAHSMCHLVPPPYCFHLFLLAGAETLQGSNQYLLKAWMIVPRHPILSPGF